MSKMRIRKIANIDERTGNLIIPRDHPLYSKLYEELLFDGLDFNELRRRNRAVLKVMRKVIIWTNKEGLIRQEWVKR